MAQGVWGRKRAAGAEHKRWRAAPKRPGMDPSVQARRKPAVMAPEGSRYATQGDGGRTSIASACSDGIGVANTVANRGEDAHGVCASAMTSGSWEVVMVDHTEAMLATPSERREGKARPSWKSCQPRWALCRGSSVSSRAEDTDFRLVCFTQRRAARRSAVGRVPMSITGKSRDDAMHGRPKNFGSTT